MRHSIIHCHPFCQSLTPIIHDMYMLIISVHDIYDSIISSQHHAIYITYDTNVQWINRTRVINHSIVSFMLDTYTLYHNTQHNGMIIITDSSPILINRIIVLLQLSHRSNIPYPIYPIFNHTYIAMYHHISVPHYHQSCVIITIMNASCHHKHTIIYHIICISYICHAIDYLLVITRSYICHANIGILHLFSINHMQALLYHIPYTISRASIIGNHAIAIMWCITNYQLCNIIL